MIEVLDMVIHPGRRLVSIAGETVDVSSTEFDILRFLASKPGWVFTRRQILRGVHGENHPVLDRSIDVQIASLRKKSVSGVTPSKPCAASATASRSRRWPGANSSLSSFPPSCW